MYIMSKNLSFKFIKKRLVWKEGHEWLSIPSSTFIMQNFLDKSKTFTMSYNLVFDNYTMMVYL